VVVVEGQDPARMKAALDQVARRITDRPELFDRLFYQVDLRHLRNRALLFLPGKQIQEIRDGLEPLTRLLLFGRVGWHFFTLQNLLQEAKTRADRLRPDAPLAGGDEQFFAQLAVVLRAADATLGDPAAYRNPWGSLVPQASGQPDLLAEPQYFFSGDGRLA